MNCIKVIFLSVFCLVKWYLCSLPIQKRKLVCLFIYVQQRATNASVRKIELIQVERMKKGRGSPKITLRVVVKKDISFKEVIETITLNRIKWRKKIM